MINTLSIIVPVYNSLFYTKKLLKSIDSHIFKNCEQLDVVVINNASTDGTNEFLRTWKDDKHPYCPRFATLEENMGFGPAVNIGIKMCPEHGDILIMNNDMELLAGCLDSLIDTAYSDPSIGIVGGRLLFPDGTVQHNGAFLGVFGWGAHKHAGVDENRMVSEEVSEQEYVTGALFYIKDAVLKEITGFDERFKPAYFEEVDYCYEVRKIGYKVVLDPNAKAIHYENITGKDIFKGDMVKVNNLSRINQIKFYLKREKDEYIPTSDQKILITSKIYGEWSFCGVMRNLAKGLNRNGVDVAIAPEEYHTPQDMADWEIKQMINKPHDYWDRVVLRSSEGDHMYLMPPGKKRIAHTTGESSRISVYWKEQLNSVDHVLTTSSFFKNVLEEDGVKTPISIIPNSVDTNKFNPHIIPYPTQGLRGFNLFSMFHFGDRKAPEILFKAFIQEFDKDDDITLSVHSLSLVYVLQQRGKSVKQWINELSGGKLNAPIIITANPIAEELIPHVMKNFDLFVLPTRGEGFGLPVAEAAALGIPSIVTGYSGVLDIVNSETGWLINYKLVDIPLQILPYFKNYIGGQWAEPSIEHLCQLMRYAYERRDEVKIKGKKAYQKSKQFSIENVGKLAKETIFS